MQFTGTMFAACLALVSAGVAAADRDPTSLEAAADRYLEPYLATGNFSGSVLVARGGEVLLSKGYGMADLEHGIPNTTGSVFHLASVSRVFTSAAIQLLAQQGKLSVDDKLSKHLPDYPNGDRITIEHLLTLSGGMPNINSMPDYDAWSMSPQTPETLVARFRDLPLEFEPGEKTVHSNSNYNLLALLIEKLSGVSFGEFLEREIFTPLGMSRTAHDGDLSRIVPNRARGYAPAGRADLVNAPWIDWSVKTGNGSLYSTVEDLYRWDRALRGGKLLSKASIDLAWTERFPNHGYGWFIRERFGSREIYINGRSPGFGSYLGRSEDRDVTAIVLGNIYNSVATTIGRDLMAMALGLEVEPPRFSADSLPKELLAELVGWYQFGPEFYSPNGRYEIRAEEGYLFIGESNWMMSTGGLEFIDRQYGSDLEFRRDDSGEVVELLWDGHVGKRSD